MCWGMVIKKKSFEIDDNSVMELPMIPLKSYLVNKYSKLIIWKLNVYLQILKSILILAS